MAPDKMTLEQALAYLRPAGASNGTISLRAPKAREAVDVIEAEMRSLRHLLMVRTRQCTRGSDLWCRAAEEAFAGRPQSLHTRVELHRAPPVDMVLSDGGSHGA